MRLVLLACLGPFGESLLAQTANPERLVEQVQQLADAMVSAQARLEQSRRELDEMQRQLNALRQQMAQGQSAEATSPSTAVTDPPTEQEVEPADIASAIQDIRDRQAMQDTQIATHEQTKVESESRFPLKITGLLLFTGFVNTGAVDAEATPTFALPGYGSTGATVRQTLLGFDARGPHLLGATSAADLRVDFDGASPSSVAANFYSGAYSTNATLLRLRTAHAVLKWTHTEAYFSLDRPIFNPDTPTSLTAVAEPPLAWSGNLWAWNPQLGVTQELAISRSSDIQLEAAWIDAGDAPLSPAPSYSVSPAGTPPGSAEQSRRPGVEARFALLGSRSNEERGNRFGVGGYFAPHRSLTLRTFDSWVATLDARLLLPAHLEFTGNAYRGLALGGLGGGTYKDFAYRVDPNRVGYYVRPLDDLGGWAQLKESINERLELNGAFGMDEIVAHELRPYSVPNGSIYNNLSGNRTYTGNVIYSPSAYLLFSLEYRHLSSATIVGPTASSNVIGLGAGFKF